MSCTGIEYSRISDNPPARFPRVSCAEKRRGEREGKRERGDCSSFPFFVFFFFLSLSRNKGANRVNLFDSLVHPHVFCNFSFLLPLLFVSVINSEKEGCKTGRFVSFSFPSWQKICRLKASFDLPICRVSFSPINQRNGNTRARKRILSRIILRIIVAELYSFVFPLILNACCEKF